jgi:hypothetical protein
MRRHVPVVRGVLPHHGRVKELHMFEEKLKEAILGEFKRQAANRPEALKVEGSAEELIVIVNGKIDLADLVMVIAGSVAGGP